MSSNRKLGGFVGSVSRRDFLVRTASVGAMVMAPRVVRADAAEPYRLVFFCRQRAPVRIIQEGVNQGRNQRSR